VADGNIKVYQLPSLDGERFGTLHPGERVIVGAATGDGWIGVEPGDTHAGDVGLFRLRWVRDGAALHLTGSCTDLPIVDGPPAGVCLAAALTEVSVLADPDESAQLLGTLKQGEYAQALGTSGDWVFLDLAVGAMGADAYAWVLSDQVSLYGPCAQLPTVTP
jgi:hypothetical protein